MSEFLKQYRDLDRRLLYIRWMHGGLESASEDDILDQMDDLWWKFTEEERELINRTSRKSLVRKASFGPHRVILRDTTVCEHPGSPVRAWKEEVA